MLECCGSRVCPFSRFYLGVARAYSIVIVAPSSEGERERERARWILNSDWRLVWARKAACQAKSHTPHCTAPPILVPGAPALFCSGLHRSGSLLLSSKENEKEGETLPQSQSFICKFIVAFNKSNSRQGNWFILHNIKAPYPFSAWDSFSLLLILLVRGWVFNLINSSRWS